MQISLKDLFPREHGFYVMASLPAVAGVALNWSHAGAAAVAAASWIILVLASAGIKTWILQPAKRVELSAPLTLIVLSATAGFILSGVPSTLMLACGIALGALAVHLYLSDPKDRRSVGFETTAAFVLGFGMLVSGSAREGAVPLPIAQAALVYTLVQVAATVHVRLWIEALGGRQAERRGKLLALSLLTHAGLIGVAGTFVMLGWLPFYSMIPGAGEGLVVLMTLPLFGQKVSFPKLGIAQTIGLAVTAVGLAVQFQN